MLQRAAGEDSEAEACDALTLVACSVDPTLEGCDACNTEEGDDEPEVVVKSGDLAVSATAAAGRKAIIHAISDTDTLTFKTSEEVEITKVVLERYGYSSSADIESVRLEDENGNIISSQSSINSRDQVSLSIKKDYRKVDGLFNATIVVALKDSVTTGGTIGFKVINAESTAKNLNLDNYTPYEYDMVGYEAASDVTVDIKGSAKTYNYEEGESYEVAKMKVHAGVSAVSINGFTFTNNGNLDLEDFLDDVEVTLDGDAIKGVDYNVDKNGKLNISFDTVEVAAKSSAVFTVNISLADFDEYGDNVRLWFASNGDFKAVEKKTGVRIQPELTPTAGGNGVLYTFAGSKVKLSNTKLGNVEFAQGSSDVVVAKGTITLAEPVEKVGSPINRSAFIVTGTYTAANGDKVTGNVIEEMRLYVAGEEYVATKVQEDDSNEAVFTFPEMEIEKSGKFEVVVDLNTDEDAPAGTVVTFEGYFDDVVFSGAEYTDSNRRTVQPDEVSGVISFASKLTVRAGKASFANNLSSTKPAEFLNNDVTIKTVFDGTYTAKKADVNLTSFDVKSALAIPKGVSITFYLYIDGKDTNSSIRLRETTIGGSDSISKVSIDAGESVNVRIDAEVNAKKAISAGSTALDLQKFAVVLNGEEVDNSDNVITTNSRNTIQMKVVEAESIKVVDSAAKTKDVLLEGSEAKLAQFTVKSSNGGDVDFNSVTFVGTYGEAESAYDPEDLIVTLGTAELDCALNGGKIVCEPNESIIVNGEGKVLTITLNDSEKATGNVNLTVSAVNKENLNTAKVFTKRFLDAIVRIEKQEFKKATTVFTLSMETADDVDEDPIGFAMYTMSGANCNGIVYESTGVVLEEGKTITVTNGQTAALICGVSYGWNEAEEKYDYTIGNAEEDYFKLIPTVEDGKTSNDDLMVSKVD